MVPSTTWSSVPGSSGDKISLSWCIPTTASLHLHPALQSMPCGSGPLVVSLGANWRLLIRSSWLFPVGNYCLCFTCGVSYHLWSCIPLLEEKHRSGSRPAGNSQIDVGKMAPSALVTQPLVLQTRSGGIHSAQNSRQAERIMRILICPNDY